MKRFFSLFLCLCLGFALLLAPGCARKNEPATMSITLSEVAHSIFYAPQYAAIELGYFEQEGIDLTLINSAGADKVMTALLSGEADIGLMGSEATIYVYNEGSRDPVINFAQLTQRAGNFLVAREPMPDFTWDSLRGQKVLGGRRGGMPQMVFEYILKQHGIDPETDLDIDQSINFGLTAAAFMENDADFTVEFEPFATSLEKEGSGHIVASLGVDSGYVPYTAYSMPQSALENNPALAERFTNAIQRGLNYVNSHTAEEIAAVIAPQFPETDRESLTAIVERYRSQDTWKKDTIFTEEAFLLLQDILDLAGELSKPVDYEALVTTEFSTRAAENIR